MRTTLLAATLNEIEAIQITLPQIKNHFQEEIIVVDGGSTDGTIEYCKKSGVQVLSQTGRGYGSGMLEGVHAATGDIIIEFPPDGNSMPEVIPQLIAKMKEGYDFVIVSRYLDKARSYDDDFLTSIGNWMFTKLTNLLYHTHYTDVLVGYRAYKKETFLKLNMDAAGLSWTLQASIRFPKNGFKVAEIPGDEPPRIGGVRKMRIIKTGLEVLKILLSEFFK